MRHYSWSASAFFVGRSVIQAYFELLDARIQPTNFVIPFCIGQTDRNMQWAVPIERIDMNDNSALGFRTVVDPQQINYIGVFRDHGVPEQFQAFLTGAIDGDQRDPVVMAQIAKADVLPVTAVVGIGECPGINDLQEARGTAAKLNVGPAGLRGCGLEKTIAGGQKLRFASGQNRTALALG
jgi:hypothetical protein